MNLGFDTIIITSDEPYSDMWHTQIIYTEFLSKNNFSIYINPPKKWSVKNIFHLNLEEKIIHKNLILIHYTNVLPAVFPIFIKINEAINQFILKKKLRKKNVTKILIWHFDSYRNSFAYSFFKKYFSIKRIYHVIDPYYNNPINNLLSEIFNVLVITSPRSNSYYKKYENKLLNIPQCIDLEQSRAMLYSLQNEFTIDKPYFVLLGTISDDIAFDWLLSLSQNKKVVLLLIGKITTNNILLKKLTGQSNVKYLEIMPPEKFYPILKNALAGLILYNDERKQRNFSPLKAINYLIANIPIISNVDCEIGSLNNHCIYNTDNEDTFQLLIDKAIENKMFFNTTLANDYLNSISIDDAIKKIVLKTKYAI